MTDDLDALKAALRAAPTPDPDAKAAALAMAMENFDRLQGSTDGSRLSQDRPERAGFLNGVRHMLKTLNTRPYLAATTSVLALCVGVFFVLPELQQVKLPVKQPEVSEKPVVDATVPKQTAADDLKADETDLGRADTTVASTDAPTPPAPPLPGDQAPLTETRSAAAEVPAGPAMDKLADSTTAQSLAAPKTLAEPVPVTPPMGTVATTAPETSAGLRGLAGAGNALSAPATAMVEGMVAPADPYVMQPEPNTETFNNAPVNPVHVTAEEPVSTFSVDVDTASYSVIRSSLNAGQLPPPEAVRIEEMVNYFPYNYPAPEAAGAPFTDTVTVMTTPWNPNTRLVHIALQGRMPAIKDRPPLNLVFLIDTSGSMEDANKLPLLKQSLSLMLSKLRPEDQIAIVAYAGSAGEVLPPTHASDRNAILNALNNLQSGGSTAGAEGLALAYQIAGEMKGDGKVSRVLLATDGDFNVGISDPEDLKTFVAKERDTGVYLSVLGFGRGNLDDTTMQTLAQNGNGTASYIDTLAEAQKVLVDQLTGALFPIADDVKIQVEWNPAQVAEYRLIGYETRALKREDFNNDKVDAGEIGAGLQVTALYEVTAPNSPALLNNALRYAAPTQTAGQSPELGFLRLRYKDPGQDTSKLIETPIVGTGNAGDDARFAAAVAGFGQLLQHSTYLGSWSYDQAIALASGARGPDEFGYRVEAVNLMRLAQSLTAQ
ncbi:MAG: von Willebrand factor type A domain-containing protein [Paracoccaceae bacterium]